RRKNGMGHGTSLRNILVYAQFCLATMLLIGTSSLFAQLAATKAMPIGFNAENTVFFTPRTRDPNFSATAVPVELNKIPGVVWAISTFAQPNGNLPETANRLVLVRNGGDVDEVRAESVVAEGFVGELGMK